MRLRLFAASLAWLLAASLSVGSDYSGSLITDQDSDAAESCDCDLCDFSDCCDSGERTLGFMQSDHCFDRFISPLTNPFFFEDPRSLTEARGLFINNNLPSTIGGGEVQVWAAQFRGRLTERMSVIAPRLAYLTVHPAGIDSPDGFASAPIGVKYNLIRDVDQQFLVSAGATYFIPGSKGAYSGFGDGDFHFFLTGGKQIYERGHWLSATGFRLPADRNWGTQMWYWSNQWDYELPGHIYPLTGVNWYHWMSNAGVNATNGIAGLDLINLPTSGVAGNNVVTGVAGVKWKPSGYFEIGGGYEFPMTNRTDILQNRVYFDMIFRY